MREILFRGRNENSTWKYGSLLVNKDTFDNDVFIYHICDADGYSTEIIDTKTVGQYTGLQDKNGTKIFEGDILLWHSEWGEDFITVVEWDNKRAYFGARESGFDIPPFEIDDDFSKVEIIGNVHDNPELLQN